MYKKIVHNSSPLNIAHYLSTKAENETRGDLCSGGTQNVQWQYQVEMFLTELTERMYIAT